MMGDMTKQIFFLDAQADEIKKELCFVLDAAMANFDDCPLPVRNAVNRAITVIQATKELNDVEALTNEELQVVHFEGDNYSLDVPTGGD